MSAAALTPLRRTVEIRNARGLHARASAKFVKVASQFDAHVQVVRDDQTVDAQSIMGLMMLAAAPGASIEIVSQGREAHEALEALIQLVEDRFDEDR